MIETRNDEAGFIEFLNDDVATIVREIDAPCAILLDMNTSQVVGYRVYDPAPTNNLKAERTLTAEDRVSDEQLDVMIADSVTLGRSFTTSALVELRWHRTLASSLAEAGLQPPVGSDSGHRCSNQRLSILTHQENRK